MINKLVTTFVTKPAIASATAFPFPVDKQIVDHLRYQGLSVWSIAKLGPGISDDAVLDLASKEDALLITEQLIKISASWYFACAELYLA